ncbi:MAG: hypothetical protein JMJ93_01985 [Synergistaceae bacterium]|jgi:methyl-accepting chemotaxis protein|nr:hypothetical protein [Synergistaceae bacterium]
MDEVRTSLDQVLKLSESNGTSISETASLALNAAASEVSKLIGSLEKSMGDSISVTEEAGAIMKATVDRVAAAVRELEKALEGTRRVIDAIGTVASTSEEQAASSEEMASPWNRSRRGRRASPD